ncbi:MAG: phosphopantothenoylcysteine decarboxylase [Planctomycetaceae bacterium]|nr:phosphopantothenoylcysteine decarboxylase [Planctomycetaceae bacterium]
MRIIVTAGPTREYIDPVRFITNASSGQMGYAVAAAAATAGHQVTLLSGPVPLPPPPHCRVVPFVSVDDLQAALAERFADCDALVMSAAVGDFRPQRVSPHKLSRSGGAIDLRLIPTQDVVAGVAAGKRPGQIVITFAVEDAPPEAAAAKALGELQAKHADYVVVNMPDAMGAQSSQACILSREAVILPWGSRPKSELAGEIVSLLR